MSDQSKTYFCVVCGRGIEGELREDGSFIFVHDDKNHPEAMDFDEESNPQ